MRKLVPLLFVLGAVVLPAFAQTYYFSPDVPTDLAGGTYLPWEIVRKDPPANYSVTLSLPFGAAADSVHAMCSGEWLVSLEAAADLGGSFYEAWDVVRYDPTSSLYSLFFCGGPFGLPPGSNVDSAFLLGNDAADLVIGFDVTTDLSALPGGAVYQPADLIQLTWGGVDCSSWSIVGLYFDSTTSTPPIMNASDVSGADRRPGLPHLAIDIPTTLAAVTYLPGDIIVSDATIPGFYLYETPPGWPPNRSSRVDAFSFLPDPGEVPSMHVDKSAMTPGDLTITWTASTSAGAEDYAIFQGQIVSPWTYNHARIICTDPGGDFTEDVTPGNASHYYLVVALNPDLEGSYGRDSSGTERPQGSPACRAAVGFDCP